MQKVDGNKCKCIKSEPWASASFIKETNQTRGDGGRHCCFNAANASLSVGLPSTDVEQPRAAVERLGRPQLGREERQRGGTGPGRAQLLRHAVLAPHPGHRVRERAGVPGRAEGTLPPDHHQLPGGEPGRGRPAGGVSGHAVGRLPGGEEVRRAFPAAPLTFKAHVNGVNEGILL